MKGCRARLMAVLALVLFGLPVSALEPVSDLEATAAEAERREVPILLAVTRTDCGYCATLKRQILEPMRLAGDDPERVLMRELDLDSPVSVVGFDGAPTTTMAIAEAYDAVFTPTVLIVGPNGAELAERIVGINTPDFYGWYLEQSIEAARAALGAGPASAGP